MSDFTGGPDADVFNGTPDPDVAHGGDGNDELFGGGGDDHLLGEGGDDTLHGGAGKDWLDGGAGDDVLVLDDGEIPVAGDRFSGGDGYDVLRVDYVSNGPYRNLGQAQFDPDLEGLITTASVIMRPDQFATFTSLDGSFYLSGIGTADFTGKRTSGSLILSQLGNTVILGADGFSLVLGLDGDDVIDGSALTRDQEISGLAGNDVLRGGSGNDKLYGGTYFDRLEGGAGNDMLSGGGGAPADPDSGASGSEVPGFDTLIGGTGDDLYELVTGTELVVELAGEGNDTVSISGASYVLPAEAEIETLRVHSPGSSLAIDLTGNGFDNRIIGAAGDNLLDGRGGADSLFSGGGTDRLLGGDGNDGMYFGADFGAGDIADGGSGTDTLVLQGNYANGSLEGMSDVEVLLVASGSDTRFGDTAGASYAYHIASVDSNIAAGGTLTVNANDLKPGESLAFDGSAESDGNFRIFAGQGVDDLKGGAGNDGFFFGADNNLTGADRILGGGGTDSIALRGDYTGANAVAFQDASFSGIEVLTFLSGHTNEYGGPIAPGGFDYDVTTADGNVAAGGLLQVIGVNLRADESLRFDGRAETDGSFRILSGSGDDILFGGAGNDTLYGGFGADAMDGGDGADVYLYRSALESTAAARDTIMFGIGDRIDLSLIDAIDGTPVNDAFAFIGANAFSNTAGELRAYQSGDIWTVEGDVNGDGAADFVLAVNSSVPLVAADFVP